MQRIFYRRTQPYTAAITCVPWPQQQQQLPATAAAAAAIEMSAE